MIISRNRLKLYYWDASAKGYPGPCNLPEIEKGEYGYDLQPGQKVFALRYNNSNTVVAFNVSIKEVVTDGVYIYDSLVQRPSNIRFFPWIQKLPNGNKLVDCQLYIEPCECLYEKNTLRDILNGNIPNETWIDGQLKKDDGEGVWYRHGGWRTFSRFECNLQNFVKLGQMEIDFDRVVRR